MALKPFDKVKHPRNSRGLFVQTADEVKPEKQRTSKVGTEAQKSTLRKLTPKQKAVLMGKLMDDEGQKTSNFKLDRLAKSLDSLPSKQKATGAKLSTAQQEKLEKAVKALDSLPVKQRAVGEKLQDSQKKKLEEKLKRAADALEVLKEKEPEKPPEKEKTVEEPKPKAARVRKPKVEKPEPESEEDHDHDHDEEPEKKVKFVPTDKADGAIRARIRKQLDSKTYAGVEAIELTKKYGAKQKTLLPTLTVAPTPREAPNKSEVLATDKGLDVWKGQEKYGKHDASYKEVRERDFEYSAEVDGKNIVLNRSTNAIKVFGEHIHGIPQSHGRLKDLTNEELFNKLADAAGHVENFVDRKIDPRAPGWAAKYNATLAKEYQITLGGKKSMGDTEIHHINQWAKYSITEITSKLKLNKATNTWEDGEITVEEAKKRQLDLIHFVEAEGKWRIKVQPLGEREFVALPKASHIGALDEANHPRFIDMETNKATQYGIPDKGEGGREYYNALRPKIWAEYYRREARIMQQEISSRIRDKELSPEAANSMWIASKAKLEASYQYAIGQQENKAKIDKAILEDYIGERKFFNGTYK